MLLLFGIFVGDVDLRLEFAAIAGGIQMNVFKGDKGEQFKKYGDTSNGVVLIELK